MVVSSAFEELTEILEYFETVSADVEDVSVMEADFNGDGELTADLQVGVPVLHNLEFRDDVAVTSGTTDLTEEPLEVELSISISVDESGDEPVAPVYSAETDRLAVASIVKSSDAPAYKDPDSLRAVYEKYNTFDEMTEALGVDVTSETVRRYMVKYGIHDPKGRYLSIDVSDESETVV